MSKLHSAQQQTSMTKRHNAHLFEVLIGQIRQDDKTDVVLGKALDVLPETKFLKPSQRPAA
jgi:hypothetical protein